MAISGARFVMDPEYIIPDPQHCFLKQPNIVTDPGVSYKTPQCKRHYGAGLCVVNDTAKSYFPVSLKP